MDVNPYSEGVDLIAEFFATLFDPFWRKWRNRKKTRSDTELMS